MNYILTKDKCFSDSANTDCLSFLNYKLITEWINEFQEKQLFSSHFDTHGNIVKAIDFSQTIKNVRFRIQLQQSLNDINAFLRKIPDTIPLFETLGFDVQDNIIGNINNYGLTLICGPTGSGKTTTLNAIVQELNTQDKLGITQTIEDPIEYVHTSNNIFQREIGKNIDNYAQGLKEALRITPRTIIIGEIRDKETAIEAIKAGLNGHRILATIHAKDIKHAIARMWSFLDDQEDNLLVSALTSIVAQELLFIKNNYELIYETLQINTQTKNYLLEILKQGQAGNLELLNHSFYEQNQFTIAEKKKKFGVSE